jgi:hypothetical protein
VTRSVRLATATPTATTVSGPPPKAAVHVAPRQAPSMVVYYSHVYLVSRLSKGGARVVCRAIAPVFTRPRMSVGRTHPIATRRAIGRGHRVQRRPPPQGTAAVLCASGYGPASSGLCDVVVD